MKMRTLCVAAVLAAAVSLPALAWAPQEPAVGGQDPQVVAAVEQDPPAVVETVPAVGTVEPAAESAEPAGEADLTERISTEYAAFMDDVNALEAGDGREATARIRVEREAQEHADAMAALDAVQTERADTRQTLAERARAIAAWLTEWADSLAPAQ